MRQFVLLSFLITLCGCSYTGITSSPPIPKADPASLAEVLEQRPEDVKARYRYRHPAQTLTFFGVAPGTTVVEALPGGGWYTRILLDYLGPEGRLIGADYAGSMWSKFGFFDDKYLAAKKTWPQDWPQQAQEWRSQNSAPVSAFAFGALPDDMIGTADTVLFIRALHNLARFESDGGYLTAALGDAYRVLKPGGVVGVVQHEAREDMSDEFASGARGYLKKSKLIEVMRAVGFEYEGSRDFNENPQDQPSEDDVVWRLPPTYNGSADNPDLRAQMTAIGESNRMTLKFRKPKKR